MKSHLTTKIGLFSLVGLGLAACNNTSKSSDDLKSSDDYAGAKPNIIIILADDMGYSDIGCYGSEIPTPNIDKLAENGLRFNQFYNTARCCPTRASLMTGLHPHQTGIGHMTKPPEKPNEYDEWGTEGYVGYLNRNCVTMAEALKQGGYSTYMTGKWHLGFHDKSRLPLQRGFDKFYGIFSGASSYFEPSGLRGLRYGNDTLPAPLQPYYTTDAFTDSAIAFVNQNPENQPFFLYLAYTAPHWPLHAKEKDIAKFRGIYKELGWDKMRENRLEKQIELGIFPQGTKLSERDTIVRPWDEVDEKQKDESDYRMATYAAQIYSMDYNIGKLVKALEESGQLDNTIIVFLSDNGACAEPYNEFGGQDISQINEFRVWWNVSIGAGWANACNTPLYKYKSMTHEGGIRTPLIVHWPATIKEQAGKISDAKAYLIDLMPTFLDAAKTDYPATFHNGNNIQPNEGISLLPVFKTGTGEAHEYMYWEHQNNCAIRWGKWKAVKKIDDEKWELYNIASDPIEANNLANAHPEIEKQLNDKWYEWADSHYVLPKKIQ